MSKKIKLIPCLLLVFLAFLLPLKSFAATAPAIAQFKVPGNTSVTSNTPFYVSENTIRNNLIFVRGAKTASSLGVVKIQAKIYIKKDLGGGVTHYSRWNGSYWTAWGHQTSYDLSLFNYNPSSSQSLIGGIQSKDIYYPTSSSSNVTSFLSEFSKDKPVYIRVRVGGQTKTGGSGFWTIIDHYSESTYTAAVKLDNIDPSISFTSPTASTYLNGAAFMQDVSGTVLDNESGIDTSYGVNTECYDKTDSTALILWPSVLTGSTWKNSMGPSFFTDGHQYEIKSTVKDKVGNSGTTSLTFTYDNTAPTNPIKVEAYKKSMLNEPAPIPPPPGQAGSIVADPNEITNLSWHKTAIKPYIYFGDGIDLTSGIKSYGFKLIRYNTWLDWLAALANLPANKTTVINQTISYQTSDTSTIPLYKHLTQSQNTYFGSAVYELNSSTYSSLSSGLADGLYEVKLTSTDHAGNTTTSGVGLAFGVDTTPPNNPTNLEISSVFSQGGAVYDGLVYKWTAGFDLTSLIKGYQIYLKGPLDPSPSLLDNKNPILLSEITNDLVSGKPTYTSTKKLIPGTYQFYMKTVDVAGKISAASDTKTFTVSLNAPELVSPADNLRTKTMPVFKSKKSTHSSSASNAIKEYTLYIYDNSPTPHTVTTLSAGAISMLTQTGASDITWTVSGGFNKGDYTWKVEAADSVGNKVSSAPRKFTVTEPIYPKITLTSPKKKGLETDKSVKFTWTTSTGFTTYDLYLDGTKITSTSIGVGEYTHSPIADGAHSWYVESIFKEGTWTKTVKSAVQNFVVDTVEPTISLSLPKDKDTKTTSSVEFSWTPSYKLSSFGLYIDGIRVKNTTEKKLTQTLADGKHTWYVASPYKGKTKKSGERTLTVNAEGPKIEVKIKDKELKNGLHISPTDELSITVTDILGVDNNSIEILVDNKKQPKSKVVSKDTAGKTVALSSKLSLSEGTHTVKVTAKDSLGKENSITFTGIKTYSGDIRLLAKPMNYPNPFKPISGQGTTINYTLSDNANIKIMIFDIGGQMVWQNSYPSGSSGGSVGENEVTWDGRSAASEILGNGVYLYTITSGGKLLDRGEISIID